MFFFGLLFYIAIFTLIGYLIAKYLGQKKQIGFRLSLFFSITLTPIFGFLVTLMTKSSKEPAPNPSKLKKIIGWVFVLCGIGLFTQIEPNIHSVRDTSTVTYIAVIVVRLMMILGVLGFGGFLLGRANGSRYDTIKFKGSF